MRDWIAASLAFFSYVAILGLILPGLRARARRFACGGAFAGLVMCAAAYFSPANTIVMRWILPPSLLLLGYWTSGLLFTAPMPRAERALEAMDTALNVDRCAQATPRWLAEVLEFAYAGIYPLIPIALLIHLTTSRHADVDRFWTVILITDYICFAVLPWVQTRPPRALRTADPWTAGMRRLNLRIVGKASIQANTFPSGHAAEGLAAALLVLDAPWPLAASVALAAILVSTGTVLGRYHYAADAMAGWFVAAGVWLVVR
jgi:hypothetical protein